MLPSIFIAIAAFAGVSTAQNTQTGTAAVAAARATALTRSPKSNVKGKAFDRIAIIWLENTDYDIAASDPNLKHLATQGITLTNYYGVTHPSEPNYVASHGGDNFGMDNDDFNVVPKNISTIIDLLDDKGISWAEYQEHMPYSGFEGYAWINQETGANDYVRKHNPAVIYGNNNDHNRLAQMKNISQFYNDLRNDKLPQWMFITPNMRHDGHDTSVTVAGKWTRGFVEPLLRNKKFLKNTLVLVTFDENEIYTKQNNVLSILLGDAVPKELVGTQDDNFYDHYSQLATVEANWGLHTLGRWDVGANVFSMVADKTGDKLRKWKKPDFNTVFLNESYPGPFNDADRRPGFPKPNTAAVHAGRTVLPSIKKTWGNVAGSSIYTTDVEIPDGQHPPAGY